MPDTTSIVTKRYYPALSEVITIDDPPEFLHFAEDGLNVLLDKVHYKNLQYSKAIMVMRPFTAWILSLKIPALNVQRPKL